MSYKSKYGSTQIRPGVLNNLSIGWDNFLADIKDFKTDKKHRVPVFLFTPSMNDTMHHYHIELNRAQALKLRNWLDDYLKDIES